MRRTLAITGVAALVATVASLTVSAAPGATTFPEVIALPNGWMPEGIAVGKGSTFYSGSLANGAITNGIEATPNGEWLIVVNSTVGALYRVDPQTGDATQIDLGGASVTAGDGLLLQGSTLYVVRNQLNTIVVIDLSSDLLQGTVRDEITSPLFDVPTTIAMFGSSLYAINARFSTPPTPTTTYTVVRVPRV